MRHIIIWEQSLRVFNVLLHDRIFLLTELHWFATATSPCAWTIKIGYWTPVTFRCPLCHCSIVPGWVINYVLTLSKYRSSLTLACLRHAMRNFSSTYFLTSGREKTAFHVPIFFIWVTLYILTNDETNHDSQINLKKVIREFWKPCMSSVVNPNPISIVIRSQDQKHLVKYQKWKEFHSNELILLRIRNSELS